MEKVENRWREFNKTYAGFWMTFMETSKLLLKSDQPNIRFTWISIFVWSRTLTLTQLKQLLEDKCGEPVIEQGWAGAPIL
jgi:hypothetical protein